MFHTSPNKITEGTIKKYGIAGDCLFFSGSIYKMSKASTFVYKADFNCVDVSDLYDESIIAELQNYFRVSENEAEKLLDGRFNAFDIGFDGEDDWYLQGKRGACAKKMGFDGVKDSDEQGTVYIIPMFNRENELELVEQ
jgi:hypothetical protein